MSKLTSDSFLPTGGVASPPAFSPGSFTSPTSQIPRSIPDYSSIPRSRGTSPSQKSYFHSSRSPSAQGRPLSPPKTRSASADDNSAALVEDWRAYTSKLRGQHDGERAHMVADRAMMEEVMAEERALWEKERDILKARIAELEHELEKRGPGGPFISPPIGQRGGVRSHSQTLQNALSFIPNSGSSAVSASGSIDSNSSRAVVPQESGRNADGSPFYAPAPRNPSRTFEPSELTALRVDTISDARESPIRVTSKELTPSDFGVHSPPTSMSELETIPESLPESIDISHIQPDLEGVSIRASALSPEFAAKVLSPQNHSPAKLSPNVKPPTRPEMGDSLSPRATRETLSPRSRDLSSAKSPEDVKEALLQPEDRRLTMHAGHTPNHSLSKFDLIPESGSATPTQVNTDSKAHTHRPSCAQYDGQGGDRDGNNPDGDRDRDGGEEDRALTGPLGLVNDSSRDDAFLAQLVEKLEEAKKSEGVSPSSESVGSRRSGGDNDDEVIGAMQEEEKDLPPLRLKPSINFGRPMGRM